MVVSNYLIFQEEENENKDKHGEKLVESYDEKIGEKPRSQSKSREKSRGLLGSREKSHGGSVVGEVRHTKSRGSLSSRDLKKKMVNMWRTSQKLHYHEYRELSEEHVSTLIHHFNLYLRLL